MVRIYKRRTERRKEQKDNLEKVATLVEDGNLVRQSAERYGVNRKVFFKEGGFYLDVKASFLPGAVSVHPVIYH